MTFSEFANLLFLYIGGDQNKGDFVIGLIRNIMKKPVLKADKRLDEAEKYVPLPDKEDSVLRIFNGGRSISKKNARKILAHLNKEGFQLYIDDFPDDTLGLIQSALQERGIEVVDEQIGAVCTELFVSILEDCANKKRKSSRKPVSNQLPQVEQATIQVSDTQMATRENNPLVKEKLPLKGESSSDDIVKILCLEPAEIRQMFPEMEAIESELEEPQVRELSEPQYYREYLQDSLKQFEIYAAWKPDPLDPDLKEKWGVASITDEFCKSIRDYGIAHFLEIAPSDLLPMKKVITEGNVVNHIRSSVRFVEHMEPALDYMLITRENEEIFNDIANFVALLRRYLNFLRENSNNLDLFANEFILILSDDDKELKQKANEYHRDLRSRLEHLEKQLKVEDECRSYSAW